MRWCLSFLIVVFSGCVSTSKTGQHVESKYSGSPADVTSAETASNVVLVTRNPRKLAEFASVPKLSDSAIFDEIDSTGSGEATPLPAEVEEVEPVELVSEQKEYATDVNKKPIDKASAIRSADAREKRQKSQVEYRLNIGDTIEIVVFDEPEMSRIATILPDGHINYLLIGRIAAVDRTFQEVADEITHRLSKYLINPVVNVIPSELVAGARAHAIILGAIVHPGRYQISASDTILDLIAIVNGFSYDTNRRLAADLRRAELLRDGEVVDIDFEALILKNDLLQNRVLEDGDIITVPYRSGGAVDVGYISVLGEVGGGGLIELSDGDRLLDILVKIGGITENADSDASYIYRDGTHIDIDFRKIVEDKDLSRNIPVLPGDFIYVPTAGRTTVTVIGAVNESGKFTIEKGDRILDIIAKSGGLLFKPDFSDEMLANLKASYIFRKGEILDVDFNRLLQNGEMKYNLIVEDGDFIYIPEAKQQQIFVFGEVANQSAIPLTRDLSLIEVLSLSGGLTDRGRFVSQAVILRGGVLNSRDVILRDLNRLFKGDFSENLMLEDGDIVYIPEIKISKWGRYTAFISRWLDFILEIKNFPDDFNGD